jgi:hypothetical protein
MGLSINHRSDYFPVLDMRSGSSPWRWQSLRPQYRRSTFPGRKPRRLGRPHGRKFFESHLGKPRSIIGDTISHRHGGSYNDDTLAGKNTFIVMALGDAQDRSLEILATFFAAASIRREQANFRALLCVALNTGLAIALLLGNIGIRN